MGTAAVYVGEIVEADGADGAAVKRFAYIGSDKRLGAQHIVS